MLDHQIFLVAIVLFIAILHGSYNRSKRSQLNSNQRSRLIAKLTQLIETDEYQHSYHQVTNMTLTESEETSSEYSE